ncbi:hypothetical protein QE250_12060 [Chromatiaceae bacterium AAb-1]|nr:hypothetical protein [Chromatiaceae bacterium AAb-1]
MAGIALIARTISRKRLPRWLIPVAAGAGMMAFQIYSEYTWFEHQASRLPQGVIVAKPVMQSSFWRPWSYIRPQVLRFIAADMANATTNKQNQELLLVDLYFFERHSPARRMPQVFYCAQQARADFSHDLPVPQPGEALDSQWRALDSDDALFTTICRYAPEK